MIGIGAEEMDKNFDEFFDELNDMANFKNFGENKEEEITNADGSRNWQANILLDNVKRLEQENAELKEKIKKYAAINEQETKDYAELKAENERLNRCLMEELHHEGNALRETIKYKQTLQEIKTIAEMAINGGYATKSDDYSEGMEIIGHYVLQKITKAEEE